MGSAVVGKCASLADRDTAMGPGFLVSVGMSLEQRPGGCTKMLRHDGHASPERP